MCRNRPFVEHQSLTRIGRIALSYDLWSLVAGLWSLVWMTCNLLAANGYSSKYTFLDWYVFKWPIRWMPITDQNRAYRLILWSLVAGLNGMISFSCQRFQQLVYFSGLICVIVAHLMNTNHWPKQCVSPYLIISGQRSLVWMACNLLAANGLTVSILFWTDMCHSRPFDKYRSLTKTVRIALSYDPWSLVWMACNLLAANGSSS
jgi:hypothetical protein